MRSLLPAILLLSSAGGLAAVLWYLERVLLTPATVERPGAPHLYPVRRLRSDGPEKLFIDTPSFRRRLQVGWDIQDQDRVRR